MFSGWAAQEKKKLGLENLSINVFQERFTTVMVFCNSAITDSSYPAHRALEDVRAMKRIFSSDLLHPLLSNLTIQSKSNIVT